MNLIDSLREQILNLDPKSEADAERFSAISSLLVCGYSTVDADNSKIIERFYGLIIEQVDGFLGSLNGEQKAALPEWFLDRLEAARKEAFDYRERLAEELGVFARCECGGEFDDAATPCGRKVCRCYLRGGSCAACADCD